MSPAWSTVSERRRDRVRSLPNGRDFPCRRSKIQRRRPSTWIGGRQHCPADDPSYAGRSNPKYPACPTPSHLEVTFQERRLSSCSRNHIEGGRNTCNCWQRWPTEAEWWLPSLMSWLPASQMSAQRSRWTAKSVSKASCFLRRPWTAAMLSPKSSTESSCCFSLIHASSSSTLARNCWYVSDSSSFWPRVADISFSSSHACLTSNPHFSLLLLLFNRNDLMLNQLTHYTHRRTSKWKSIFKQVKYVDTNWSIISSSPF